MGFAGLTSSSSATTVSTPTSNASGADSVAGAGDGSTASGSGVAVGRQGKIDNSLHNVGNTTVSNKNANNTTTTFAVNSGGQFTYDITAPVGNPTTPISPMIVPVSAGTASLVGNAPGQGAGASTGTAAVSPVKQWAKYAFIATFPILALILWAVFFRNRKRT